MFVRCHGHAELDREGDMEYQYRAFLRDKKCDILEELGTAKFAKELFKKLDPSLGSSPTHMPLTFYYCANNSKVASEKNFCTKEGKFRCTGCFLVAYCSKDCQRKHWKIHIADCNPKKQSADCISSVDWQPDWIREERSPYFRTDFEIIEKCNLWGTTPAVDVINWNNNETKNIPETTEYKEPITLVFAASGKHVLFLFVLVVVVVVVVFTNTWQTDQ